MYYLKKKVKQEMLQNEGYLFPKTGDLCACMSVHVWVVGAYVRACVCI